MHMSKRLLLIDGTSYLYRAYYAMPGLRTKEGEASGAIHGVVNMMQTHLREGYDRMAFVMDGKGPTFRHNRYKNYKATRTKSPPEVHEQTVPVRRIITAMNVPLVISRGVEADDIIGTYATLAAHEGYDVTISTGDKDFAQLVNKRIKLYDTRIKKLTDTKGVIERYGVKPNQFVDYLAFMGDSIDNIPGLRGCGPKTASTLIAAYGTLEDVLKAGKKGKIQGAMATALKDKKLVKMLRLSQELVRIKTDCRLRRSVDDLKVGEPNTEALQRLYTRYQLTKALKMLQVSRIDTTALFGA